MLKKITMLFVLVFLAVFFISGCESQDSSQAGCTSSTYDYSSDQIEFKLPSSTENGIAGYLVELHDPVTKASLGSQEGNPGDVLIFELDRPKVYVNATLTAMDAGGAVLSVAKVAVVDVDVMNQICEVTVDTAAVINSAQTSVDVEVTCFGRKFTDLHIDPSK